MAFGFTPKHEEELQLNGFDSQHYLAISLLAADRLKWTVNYVSSSGFIAYTNKGLFSWNSEFKLVISEGTVTVSSTSVGSEMFDWGKNKGKVSEFFETYEGMQSVATSDEIENKLHEIKDNLVADEEDILLAPPATASENFKGFLSWFIPQKDYFITPIIINLNIFIFLLMIISGANILLPDNDTLLAWGANFKPLTLSGDWWRIITSTFIHIGILHLLFNMYALLYIGTLLERHMGKARFIAAYLITGTVASLTSLCWHDLTISAGASGAIFGLYGVFLAMLTTNFIEKNMRKQMLTSIGIFVFYNLLYGMKEGIDNAAHIGGLLSGIIVGYAFYPSLIKPNNLHIKHLIITVLSVITIVASFIIYTKTPNAAGQYQVLMKDFVENENTALSVLNSATGKSDPQIATELKEVGLANWNKNIMLLKQVKKLDLPDELKQQNVLLTNYCNLRVRSYTLMIKSLEEKTLNYDQSIDSCHNAINDVITQLNSVTQ